MFQSGSEGRAAQQCAVLTRLLSPLLANIALSVLDEHLHGPWKPDGTMSTEYRRARRRAQQLPTWRMVRYSDDFVVMVHGTRQHVEALREEIAQVLAPMGLQFSAAKTQVVQTKSSWIAVPGSS
jgi:RNA-directed DNA polymerase